MKITTTTTTTHIEANAEELRQGNSLADGFTRMLRNCFNGGYYQAAGDDEDDEDEEEAEE